MVRGFYHANGKMTKAEALGFSDIAVEHVCRYV